MKKTILMVLSGLSLTFNLFGQNSIIREHDIMENKDYFYMKRSLLISDDGKIGFNIRIILKEDNKNIKYNGIAILASGIGACHEKDVLIILFDDGTTEKLNMWNDFNCSGNIYMDINGEYLDKLNKKIKSIRLSNGRTYDEYTRDINKKDDKNFFIDVISAINKQEIINK